LSEAVFSVFLPHLTITKEENKSLTPISVMTKFTRLVAREMSSATQSRI